jgi:death-on-curing protein
MQPWFLDIDHTLKIHLSLIETYGGVDGIRDNGLLQSALAMPQASFGGEYLHKDVFDMGSSVLVPHCTKSSVLRWQ